MINKKALGLKAVAFIPHGSTAVSKELHDRAKNQKIGVVVGPEESEKLTADLNIEGLRIPKVDIYPQTGQQKRRQRRKNKKPTK